MLGYRDRGLDEKEEVLIRGNRPSVFKLSDNNTSCSAKNPRHAGKIENEVTVIR